MSNHIPRGEGSAEEQRTLADFSHAEITRKDEEITLAEREGSWNSVYKPTTVSLKYERRPGIARYLPSLRHFLPFQFNKSAGNSMPVDSAGCFAFVFFSWLTPLIWQTFRRGLMLGDLYSISPEDSCEKNGSRFTSLWDQYVAKTGVRNVPLSRTLFTFVCTRYLVTCFMYVMCLAFGFVGPTLFMRFLLLYIQDTVSPYDSAVGISLMFGLILCEFFRLLFYAIMWAINVRTAIRAASAMRAVLYRKVLKMNTVTSSSGELINLFSNDCQKVFMMVYNSPLIVGGPLVIIGSIIYTWFLFGPFCFVGVVVFVLSYALQALISWLIAKVQKAAAKATDERVSLMSEFLNNMKLIKLNAWERPLIDLVRDARAVERTYLERSQYLHTVSSSIATLSPVVATIFTILIYTLCGNNLTPAEAFTLVIVNSVASHGISTLPLFIRNFINGAVSVSRLQTVLHIEDKDSYISLPTSIDHVLSLSKATLAWETINSVDAFGNGDIKGEVNLTILENEKQNEDVTPETALVTVQSEAGLPPSLIDINLILTKGKLVGVCGNVGCGKSSLISALLGQMKLVKGHVALRGSIAYVPQQPWIMNTSWRENILFGQTFNSKRYYEAIYCCGLTEDIAALPSGDQTEIGEKGATLSGGQCQRTSLARAQYADREIYLLDDPLSAVDSQLGKHIFHHCIKGVLKEKTILLVTNQIKYLQECDTVVFMREGTIVEQGTHKELISTESEYAMFVDLFSKSEPEREIIERPIPASPQRCSVSPSRSVSSKSPSMSDFDDAEEIDDHLVDDEKIRTGSISWDAYMSYIHAAGGFIIAVLVLVWFLMEAGGWAFSKYWLSYWLSQGYRNSTYVESITENEDIQMYQVVYGMSIVFIFTISIILGFLFTKTSLRASSVLHNNVLIKIFRSPMHFFDTTPTGRILNIFTSDTDGIDRNLPMLIHSFLHKLMTVIFTLLLVVVVYYWFLIPLVLLLACFIFVQRLFRAASRDLKRLEHVTRSPIFTHVGLTIQGLPTIKAFGKEDEFFARFSELVDRHASPQYLFNCSMRWLGIRMDLLCLIITIVTSMFVVFLKGEVNPAYAALALTLAMQLGGMYQFLVRLGCDVESRFTSVERIQSYTEELESEAPPIIEKFRPSPDWPTRGRICFIDVKMRYRPGLPLALKGISFDVEPQEKIGIVGKTGAGKSSIGAALFRLVELQSGNIFIDGINIKDLGLEDLRSKMSIIPQDPVLLQGTVRYNLDPFDEHGDDELWEILDRTHIKEKVISLKDGLEHIVYEHGDNFSVGEKQLLCMSRALLKQSKIVLLDEATASVDSETDKVIQKTIKEIFANSTVLTIAHRLTTVKNCDRVLVVSDGKIAEFDEPNALLSNPKSAFSRLMTASTEL